MSETEISTEAQVANTDDLDAFSTSFFGQESVDDNASETKPAKTEQDSGSDDDAGVENDAQTPDPNDDLDAEYKETPPKKKTVQDRIDELVKQREDVKRDADARIEALRKEFEDFKKGATKGPDQATEAAEPTPDDLTEDGDPKYALGEFDPKYVRDLTRFTFAQEKERAQKEAEVSQARTQQDTALQELQTNWNTKLEEAKTVYPDLVEKGQTLLNGFNDLNTDYAGYLTNVIMSMDKGPDVLYYLSEHPDEARTIVNSGAQKATLALGRIESKFLDADAQKQLAKPRVSSAPVPPNNNVRARGTNGAFIGVAPDTDDLDAFSREFFKKK